MKKQIPNMLSVLRLLMIPVFVLYYFNGSKTIISASIYVLAWITDALDGYLARRNNWITDIGKILDPVADKLMQITAAACFSIENPIFLVLLIPLVIKEFVMLIGTLTVLKRKKIVVQANWYGKLATIVMFVCAFWRIIIRNNATVDYVVCSIMVAMMIFALVMYYIKDFKGKYQETLRKH